MSILIGAVAYRAFRGDDERQQIDCLPMTRQHSDGATSKEVSCPKCGEQYLLVEGSDASENMLQEDMEFLAKALSSGHPSHPERLLIRDPKGLHPRASFEAERTNIPEREPSAQNLAPPRIVDRAILNR